ncbi:hypothetical protein E2C01_001870 [Portunus trituberculatus]|uniref:Uncharacterized protein n=1 Tax=Portunus trituberculatus TaxID=210409 RepID=A0A5B7CLH7_PORTR|nr:hypothetical protein [Portunus trituberculatus]
MVLINRSDEGQRPSPCVPHPGPHILSAICDEALRLRGLTGPFTSGSTGVHAWISASATMKESGIDDGGLEQANEEQGEVGDEERAVLKI